MKRKASIIVAFLWIVLTASTGLAAYGDPVFNNPVYANQAGASWFHVTDQTIDVYGDGNGDGKPDVIDTQHNVDVDVIQGPDQDWSGTGVIQPGALAYGNFHGAPDQYTSGWGGAAAGGSLVVGFSEDFIDGEGNDFMVHGFGFCFNKAFSDERGTVNIYVADASYNPTVSSADPVTGLVTITGDESKWVKISGWQGRRPDDSWVGNPNMNYASAPGAYGEFLWGDLNGSGLSSARYIKFELGDGGHYDDPYSGAQNTGRALFIDAVEARGYEAPANNPPVLADVGDKSVDEETELRFTLSATDPDDHGLSYTFTSEPAMTGASLDSSSGAFAWTPADGTEGIYTVTFTVTDDGIPPAKDSGQIEISVGAVNHAPEFHPNAPIGTYAVLEGQSLEFTVAATDADMDILTYNATNLPEGATFSSQKFSWTPGYDDAGTYTVKISVTDNGSPPKSATRNVVITVGNVAQNSPPQADAGSAQTVTAGDVVSLDGSGSSDPDSGDTLSYAWNQTSGVAVTLSDNNVKKPSFTAPDPGNGETVVLVFELTVSDSQATDSAMVSITVEGQPVAENQPPQLGDIGPQTLFEMDPLSLTLSATDPDANDTLTYSYTATPALTGATIDAATGVFSWTPDLGTAGTYTVVFKATDDGDPPKSDEKSVTITVSKLNRAPELDSVGPRSGVTGSTVTVTLSATDPDTNDTVSYSYTATPALPGAVINAATGVFTWTPAVGTAGTYTVVFKATDNGNPSKSDEESVTLTISEKPENQPPVLASVGDKSVTATTPLTIHLSANDPDTGDTITYSYNATPALAGAAIDTATGVFTWTPAADKIGTYTVVFRATDNGSPPKSDEESITVTVTENDANHSPKLAALGDRNVIVGDSLNLTLSATDPDAGDTISYSYNATPALAGAVINAATGVFSWTPAAGMEGSYAVTFAATDDGTPPMSDEEKITIMVAGGNQPPVADAGPDQTVNKGALVTLDATGSSDPDQGDTLTYVWTRTDVTGLVATLSDDTDPNATFTAPDPGEDTTPVLVFELTASDADGLSSTDTVEIRIENPAGPDQTVKEQTAVTLGIPENDSGHDPDTQFKWEQTAGPAVVLNDDCCRTPSFIAPAVDATDMEIFFRVTLNAGAMDEVRITVQDNGIQLSEEEKQLFSDATVIFENPVADGSGEDPCNMGIDSKDGELTFYEVRDPAEIGNQEGRPETLTYGVFDFNVTIGQAQEMGSLTIYLPEPAPEDYKWYKYSESLGWFDFSRDVISGGTGDGAVFNEDRTQVTIYITDGGQYDDDGVVNGQVKDPSGLGAPKADTGGGGDSGCFINTTARDGGMEWILIALLIVAPGIMLTTGREKSDLENAS